MKNTWHSLDDFKCQQYEEEQAAETSSLDLVYDQNGNLVTGDGKYRVYNSLNQLWKVYSGSSEAGDLLFKYGYHPTQERVHYKVRHFDDGSNETTIYVSENFVRVINSTGSFDYTYVYHNGQQVAQLLPDGSKEFIHGDHIGSSSVVTNEAGDVIENTTYAPFGSIVSGGTETRYQYEAKEYDNTIGTYDFHFRQYNPSWGMFMKPDSLLTNVFNPQEINRYSFERNNPYKFMDPTGHRGSTHPGSGFHYNQVIRDYQTLPPYYTSDFDRQTHRDELTSADLLDEINKLSEDKAKVYGIRLMSPQEWKKAKARQKPGPLTQLFFPEYTDPFEGDEYYQDNSCITCTNYYASGGVVNTFDPVLTIESNDALNIGSGRNDNGGDGGDNNGGGGSNSDPGCGVYMSCEPNYTPAPPPSCDPNYQSCAR